MRKRLDQHIGMHCITGGVAGVMGRSHSVCSDANSRACGSSQWQARTTAQGGPGMRCPCTRRRSGRDAVCLWLCASSQRNEFCVWVNQMPNLLGSVGTGYPLSPAARLDPGSWQLCSVSQGVHQLGIQSSDLLQHPECGHECRTVMLAPQQNNVPQCEHCTSAQLRIPR